MNRGRFIGLAGLPVLLIGGASVAIAETPIDSRDPAAQSAVDSQWAARWKAAAEAAAKRVASDAQWSARWKVAAEARRVEKAKLNSPREQHPAPSARPLKAPNLPAVAATPMDRVKTQLLTLAPRRPKLSTETSAQTSTDTPPADTTAAPATTETPAAETPVTNPESQPATQPIATSDQPTNPDNELVPLEDYKPLGYADSPFDKPPDHDTNFGGRNRRVPQSDFFPIPDRFRVGLPGDYVQNTRGSLIDPYHQNVLKGDYPIIDRSGSEDDLFMNMTLTSDTLFEARRLPVPTSVSSEQEGQRHFFEHAGDQQLVIQNFVATFELFEGDTAYKPRDFEFRVTMVGNLNYLHTEQTQVTNIDFREGNDRYDEEFAFQELFFEKHLMDLSSSYDVLALRAGIQGFNSDFRGFLFSDNLPGVRLFGNYDNNKWQYNLAYFRQVEKDTNSGLNTFNDRDQNIVVANVYRQDFIWPGYTTQLSFHYNNDNSSDEAEYDKNGFLVRPAPTGTINSNHIDAVYLGWAGDGHIGRLNLTHQLYQVFGRESANAIAGHEVDINAQFAALEASYDVDYVRYRASFAYASGDEDPTDSDGTGFDTIFDNPNFAGGGINYFIRQPVRLTGSGIGLKQRLSLVPNLRTSKEQGQANFVNPGLFLFNLGADVELTPKIKLIGNASYLRFADTSAMELLLQDNGIDQEIGFDLSLGVIYRPFLNNNVIITGGAACLIPGEGFKDLYDDETLYSLFTAVTLTY